MLNKKVLAFAALLLAAVVLAAGYNRPYRWWPVNDLTEQEYIKAFTPDSGRAPSEGSVAIGQWDEVPPTLEVLQQGGEHPDIVRPDYAVSTPESIKRGSDLYDIYCYACHGQKMSVNPDDFSPIKKGTMEGRYALLAPGLERLSQPTYTDKYIYATITHGSASGLMKRMSYHLSPEERWDVVNYVRSLVDEHNKAQ